MNILSLSQVSFRKPPNEYRTLQIIHGFDNLGEDEKTIGRELERICALGIGGLVTNVSFSDYLRSEKQWNLLLSGIESAEELGLKLWIYDEEGYPSGSAGGRVLERDPEFEAIGLTRGVGDDGRPRYEVRRMYEGTHCTENVHKKRRYINLLNEGAVRTFIELTHGAYEQRIRDIGTRIHAIFTDEPSLMTTYIKPPAEALPTLPWVEDLPQEFKRRRGYELEPHLESLFTDVDNYRGVRCDFYEALGELLSERFLGQIQEWCRGHGVASSGHLLAEETLLWHVMYYGDDFANLRRMDIPGIDVLTSDPRAMVEGRLFMVPKLISSAAHVMGRYETMSETSDYVQRLNNTRVTLAEMKATANIQYLLGINTITSYYTHLSGSEQERKDYASYNEYVGRLSLMLRNARHICQLAVLYPIAGIQANCYPTKLSMYEPHPSRRLTEIDEGFTNLCRFLLQHQLDFDMVDEAAVQRATVEDRRFRIAEESYRALLIPDTDAMHISTLERIAEMSERRVTVMAVRNAPTFAAGHNEDDDELREISERLFSNERLLPGADLGLVRFLNNGGCGDISIEPQDPNIWVAHYVRDAEHIHFIINLSKRAINFAAKIPRYESVSLWDPNTGEIKELVTDRSDRGTRVEMALAGYGSAFLVCEHPSP